MHTDVQHDARRAHPLAIEHAEPVGGVIEVPELLHESLGVERPPLGVARGAGQQTPPRVELCPVVDGLRDLQVVTGNALVVNGRQLPPRVELLDTLGH